MIALYYCYTPYRLEVIKHINFHQKLCTEYFLNGRVRVSDEGINGVLSGSEKMLKKYEDDVRQHLRKGIDMLDSSALDTSKNEENNSQKIGNGESLISVEKQQSNMNQTFCIEYDNFAFDVKYCHLRSDIPQNEQIFSSLSVKKTREVVSLHEPNSQIYNLKDNENPNSINRNKKNKWRRRKRRRNKQQQQQQENNWKHNHNNNDNDQNYIKFDTATHLTPQEWHYHLTNVSSDKILIDARNIYESNVGHFKVPGIPTLLTNTRKYSSLPQILNLPEVRNELKGKEVYMYCTGGVRCERASQYLASLTVKEDLWKSKDGSENDTISETDANPPLKIYQLEGGIQKYLEYYGEMETTMNKTRLQDLESSSVNSTSKSSCLYKGKNFVFDPRRTDPKIGPDSPGKCLLCSAAHNDYDNGHSPSEGKEARCRRCRILILVCNSCRTRVNCWGDVDDDNKIDIFCGKDGLSCVNQGNNLDDIQLLNSL